MDKKKLTSFKITKSLQEAEKKVLEISGLKRKTYHIQALEKYFQNEHPQIEKRLLIKDKNDPKYVVRGVIEPVYLSEAEREKLESIARKYDTSIGTVFLQALLEYTVLSLTVYGIDEDYK